MNVLVDSIKFLFFFLTFCFVPGKFILDILKVKLKPLFVFTYSSILGICLITILGFILGLVGAIPFLIFPIIIINLLFFKKNGLKIPIGRITLLLKENLSSLLLIFFGIIGQCLILFLSGRLTPQGMVFYDFRDAMWHIALTRQLTSKILPVHPGFAPELVNNYHFFSDLFSAMIIKFTNISSINLYFRFIPLLLSLLLGLSVLSFIRFLTKNRLITNLSIFLTYFGGSFAYLLPLYKKNFDWHESSFWVSQTFTMLTNPPFIFSVLILLSALTFFKRFLKTPQKNLAFLSIFLFGILAGFKVYGFILSLFGLLTTALVEAVFLKRTKTIKIFFATLIFGLCLLIPLTKNASSFLEVRPVWYLISMVESRDRLHLLRVFYKTQQLILTKNYLFLSLMYLLLFLVFLIGNLGTRVIGFLFVIKKITKKGLKWLKPGIFVFCLSLCVFALIIPMLFTQKGSVANTIQFLYYPLIFANFATACAIKNLAQKLSKSLKTLMILAICVLSLPTLPKHFQRVLLSSPTIISHSELKALNFLEERLNSEDIILLNPSFFNKLTMYVSALSGQKTYYSDRLMTENTLKDYQKREKEAKDFFDSLSLSQKNNFVKENKISYVYLNKENDPFNLKEFGKIAFENDKIVIYRTKYEQN